MISFARMRTGDAGTMDADGYVYVADCVKDMIVTGGENVYSIEVERALFLHPGVREAAVIGVPSEQWGEAVHAVIVTKESESVTPEELRRTAANTSAATRCRGAMNSAPSRCP